MSKERAAIRIASRFLHQKMKKTAGEVRFIKDNSGDASSWAFSNIGPSQRELLKDFTYDEKQLEPLAESLLSTTAAMAHAMRAYEKFNNLRSSDVSPDGRLGGRGYIQNIKDMRKQFTNIVEALSAISDTLYDEIRAPHWARISRTLDEEIEAGKEKSVESLIGRTEDIRENPEGWVKKDLDRIEREEKDSQRPKKRIKKITLAEKMEREEKEKKEREEKEKKEREEKEKKEREEKEKKEREEKEKKEREEKEKKEREEKEKKEREEKEKKEREEKEKKEKNFNKERDRELKKMNRTPHRRK